MEAKETIALCIPAYNAGKFLPRLLMSAKKQLILFDEIIVYNDCSTDETEKVALEHGATVINGQKNVGCSTGKNILANNAASKWIHFHDADDELLPHFTTLAHNLANDLQCPDIVLFAYEYRDNETNELIMTRRFNKEELETDPISYSIREQINPFCGLYRKSAFIAAGGYDTDPAILYNEDSAMHIKMAIHGLSFTSVQDVSIINYRIAGSMSSSNAIKCIVAQKEVMRQTLERLEEKKTLIKYEPILSEKLYGLAGCLGAHKSWEAGKDCMALLKQIDPQYKSINNPIARLLARISPGLELKVREGFNRIMNRSNITTST